MFEKFLGLFFGDGCGRIQDGLGRFIDLALDHLGYGVFVLILAVGLEVGAGPGARTQGIAARPLHLGQDIANDTLDDGGRGFRRSEMFRVVRQQGPDGGFHSRVAGRRQGIAERPAFGQNLIERIGRRLFRLGEGRVGNVARNSRAVRAIRCGGFVVRAIGRVGIRCAGLRGTVIPRRPVPRRPGRRRHRARFGVEFRHRRRRQDHRFGRRHEGAGNLRRLIGRRHGLRAALGRDDHFPGAAAGIAEHGKDIGRTLGRGHAAARCAANADGRHRRRNGTGIDTGLGDLSGNEGEQAFGDADRRLARLACGVINHFVDDHGAVIGQRKRALIGERDADGAAGAGFDHVALIDGFAVARLDPGAVGADNGNAALKGADLTDRLRPDGRALGEFHGLHAAMRRNEPRLLRQISIHSGFKSPSHAVSLRFRNDHEATQKRICHSHRNRSNLHRQWQIILQL